MKIEIDVPEELELDMKKFNDVNWNDVLIQAIRGLVQDFTILDKMKEFWGQKKKK